ncbi:MAG: HAD family hydrolase [Candidatus Altiarchaeota archaeon]
MKRIILFDLDDTLMEEEASVEDAFYAACRPAEEKYHIRPGMLVERVRGHSRILWKLMPTHPYCREMGISSWEGLSGDFSGEGKGLSMLRGLVGEYRIHSWFNALMDFGVHDEEFAQQLSERFRVERDRRHVLYPDSLEVLDRLSADHPLGLITNGAPMIQWGKINATGIKDYFKHILVSCEIGYGKPDGRIFKAMLSRFGAEPGEACMIGDSRHTDILGANQCRIESIWVNRDESRIEDGITPDRIIRDLRELV